MERGPQPRGGRLLHLPDSREAESQKETDPLVRYWLLRPSRVNLAMLQKRKVTANDMKRLRQWREAFMTRYYYLLKNDSVIDFFNPFPIGWGGSSLLFRGDSIYHGHRDFVNMKSNGGRWSYDEKTQVIHSQVRIGFNTYKPVVLALTDSFLVLQGEPSDGVMANGSPAYPTCTSTIMIYKRITSKEE